MSIEDRVAYLWERERSREYLERVDAVERSFRLQAGLYVSDPEALAVLQRALGRRLGELRAEFGR